MAYLSGAATLSLDDLYTNETALQGGLYIGAFQMGGNGKFFRYARVGGTALVTANVLQAAAADVQFTSMAVTASAVAAANSTQTVNVTNGTTTVAAHDYDGGSVQVMIAPDFGFEYTITGHTTATSGAALVLSLDRPIHTAWTTATKVAMKKSPFADVIQAPATTSTGVAVGGAMFAAASSTSAAVPSYCWIQSHGVGSALSDATSIISGSAVQSPSSAAGAVGLGVAAKQIVGTAMQAVSSTSPISIFWGID